MRHSGNEWASGGSSCSDRHLRNCGDTCGVAVVGGSDAGDMFADETGTAVVLEAAAVHHPTQYANLILYRLVLAHRCYHHLLLQQPPAWSAQPADDYRSSCRLGDDEAVAIHCLGRCVLSRLCNNNQVRRCR